MRVDQLVVINRGLNWVDVCPCKLASPVESRLDATDEVATTSGRQRPRQPGQPDIDPGHDEAIRRHCKDCVVHSGHDASDEVDNLVIEELASEPDLLGPGGQLPACRRVDFDQIGAEAANGLEMKPSRTTIDARRDPRHSRRVRVARVGEEIVEVANSLTADGCDRRTEEAC